MKAIQALRQTNGAGVIDCRRAGPAARPTSADRSETKTAKRYVPIGQCPYCGYRLSESVCSECGRRVPPADVVSDPQAVALLAWERAPILKQVVQLPLVVPRMMNVLRSSDRVPSAPLQVNWPMCYAALFVAFNVFLSLFGHIRELLFQAWGIYSLLRWPALSCVLCGGVTLIAAGLLRRLPHAFRVYWRALIYSSAALAVMQLLWLLWMSNPWVEWSFPWGVYNFSALPGEAGITVQLVTNLTYYGPAVVAAVFLQILPLRCAVDLLSSGRRHSG